MEKLAKFKALGLSEETLKALKKKGFEEPTPIQEKTIPLLLKGEKDVVGQAETGTGKTAAFGLPILERLIEKATHIQALILVPTRDLALQVSEEIYSLKGIKRLNIAPIYGGQSIEMQIRRLEKGIDIVVGTPGRVIDHLNRRTLNLQKISYLILDEADEMLNMGFIDDVEEILKKTNPSKRTLLFSATMPNEILHIAKKHMREYEYVQITKNQLTTNLTDQLYFEVSEYNKFEALCRIIDVEKDFYGLIFCRTKNDVDQLSEKLIERGYEAQAIHGDKTQALREQTLQRFKKRKISILVATDVAARGLDINNLSHVINYSLPQDPEAYIHRIGRTGRAGKEGTAITFVTPEEYRKLLFIKKIAHTDIRKEKLPNVADVINAKKERIKSELEEIITDDAHKHYLDLAEELLATNEPKKIISSLLKHYLDNELDEKNYNEIREVSVDRKGKARLFVALGRTQDMSPRKLVDFVTSETGVPSNRINEVRICENFSFITVSFSDAEQILDVFRKKDGRSLIEKAKDPAPNNNRSR